MTEKYDRPIPEEAEARYPNDPALKAAFIAGAEYGVFAGLIGLGTTLRKTRDGTYDREELEQEIWKG